MQCLPTDRRAKESLERCDVSALQNSLFRNEQTNACHGIVCGQVFEEGVVYPMEDPLLLAKKAAAQHVAQEDGDLFSLLLSQGKALTWISDIQEQMLRGLHSGQSDKQIALDMGNKSETTVRNHRLQLRKHKKKAKIFLALMELLERDGATLESLLNFQPTCRFRMSALTSP